MDCLGTYLTHVRTLLIPMFKVLRNGLPRYILHTCPHLVDTRVQSATEWTASVHTSHMSAPCWYPCSKCYGMDCLGTYLTHVRTLLIPMFKVLRNGLPRYILHTCPHLVDTRVQSATEWTASVHTSHMSAPCWYPCSKCYGMDCLGTYFTHVRTLLIPVFKVLRNGLPRYILDTCPHLVDTRVQSATEWAASVHTWHMSAPCWYRCSKCYGMDCLGTYLTHVRTLLIPMFKVLRNGLPRHILDTCPNPNVTRVQSATEWTASVHTSHMSAPCWYPCSKFYGMDCLGTYFTHVRTLLIPVFKVLRNGLPRYILHTCPHLVDTRVQSATEWTASVHTSHMSAPCWYPCSKCYGMDCLGTYFTHVRTLLIPVFKVLRNGLPRYILHTCPHLVDTRVQSATEWTASVHTWHMSAPCWYPCSKCYGMDCLGTYFTHVRTLLIPMFKVLRNGLPRYILHTCPHLVDTRVQSATEWTASVHTSHMSAPCWYPCSKCYGMDCLGTYFTHVRTLLIPVFKVLRNGLPRYILHTCPHLVDTRVQSATEWTASVHTWHMSAPCWYPCSKCYGMDCLGTYLTHVRTLLIPVFKVLRNGLPRYILDTCPHLVDTRVQSATEWTASVHTWHMPTLNVTQTLFCGSSFMLMFWVFGLTLSAVCGGVQAEFWAVKFFEFTTPWTCPRTIFCFRKWHVLQTFTCHTFTTKFAKPCLNNGPIQRFQCLDLLKYLFCFAWFGDPFCELLAEETCRSSENFQTYHVSM